MSDSYQIKPVQPYFQFVEAYMVPSYTVKTSYLVTLNDCDEWFCSCPAWIYARPTRNCKHIQRVLNFRKSFPEAVIKPAVPVTRFAVMDV